MSQFKDLCYNILIQLNEFEDSIMKTKATYPEIYGPHPENQRPTVFPLPDEVRPLCEKMSFIQALVVGMVTIATTQVDQRVAEGHRRQFLQLQLQVLEMLEVRDQILESCSRKYTGSRP